MVDWLLCGVIITCYFLGIIIHLYVSWTVALQGPKTLELGESAGAIDRCQRRCMDVALLGFILPTGALVAGQKVGLESDRRNLGIIYEACTNIPQPQFLNLELLLSTGLDMSWQEDLVEGCRREMGRAFAQSKNALSCQACANV